MCFLQMFVFVFKSIFFETLLIIKDEHIELTLLLCNYMFNICKVLYYIMPLMSMYCQM